MKYDYKKYPITTGVIGVCILVYIYTTIRYGVDMNANEGLETGGFNPILVVYFNEYYRLITANFIHYRSG